MAEDSDIVTVISGHVALKEVGRWWYGRCPFHGGNDESFAVSGESGRYYCFRCGAKGDATTFRRDLGV